MEESLDRISKVLYILRRVDLDRLFLCGTRPRKTWSNEISEKVKEMEKKESKAHKTLQYIVKHVPEDTSGRLGNTVRDAYCQNQVAFLLSLRKRENKDPSAKITSERARSLRFLKKRLKEY